MRHLILKRFLQNIQLRLLQNTVGDVMVLSYVKKIGDQDIARGNPPLAYEGSCSTYNKRITLPGKQKRAVYSTAIAVDDRHISVADTLDGEYAVYTVDTDVSDIMVNANHFGKRRATKKILNPNRTSFR
jgi:hypothetical protein